MRAAVTGGAGFIGSHLSESLLSQGHDVIVIDDLSGGRESNIPQGAELIRKDVRGGISAELEGVEALFHLAADPDVRGSAAEPERCFDLNVRGTLSVLESCRKAGVGHVVLASTSTVYGRPQVFPTPETHPCVPLSNYGASKLSCEAFLSSYSATYGIKGTSLRFANIFGERSTHGVMYDFFRKLRSDPTRLEILGDGKQDKSYLYVSDCVSAILAAWKGQEAPYDVFNVGSAEKVTVDGLAGLMCRIMGLSPRFEHRLPEGVPAGQKGGGWAGDVRTMLLECSKLEALGWRTEVGFEEGMRRYVGWLSSVKL